MQPWVAMITAIAKMLSGGTRVRRERQPYAPSFFKGHEQGAARSAQAVVPLVLKQFDVQSVVDVGCGTGICLAEFAQHGIADYLGIDGQYVPREMLRIPADRFIVSDLSDFALPQRSFDLACSLEVAEHLPPECAEQFVAALAALAPAVLFSAAIPGQGGTNHLNEQWQSYWAALFARSGFVGVDCVRPNVFNNSAVELWYRQNIIIYCRRGFMPSGFDAMTWPYDFDRVDPELFRARCDVARR
jgi:SAM-dependent methyltransferase